jgi:hypothetical protein
MWSAKEYLAQECANLGDVLHETLRFKYGSDGSSEFFTECQVRLQFLQGRLDAPDVDSAELAEIREHLGELSELIARIERSSVEEYSWPFVECLKEIATVACSEATAAHPSSPPKVHVLSDGGLDSYGIYPEQSRPSAAKRRILTIVFPRTLKHFVLLHAILGHELGHAIWRIPYRQRDLRYLLLKHLRTTGPFEDSDATAAWLYSDKAPEEVKRYLGRLDPDVIDQKSFFPRAANWEAWMEEILCDFIGVATFGPSFIAACCNLLYAIDPSGLDIGPRHPPVACRVGYLLTAAAQLGLDRLQYQDSSLNDSASRFWQALRAKRKADPWLRVFTDVQIKGAAEDIGQYIAKMPPAGYVQPGEQELSALLLQLRKLVPPVGFSIRKNLAFDHRQVDFRHVLYAGWLASTDGNGVPFEKINRLCEHAIMQQFAINTSLRL